MPLKSFKKYMLITGKKQITDYTPFQTLQFSSSCHGASKWILFLLGEKSVGVSQESVLELCVLLSLCISFLGTIDKLLSLGTFPFLLVEFFFLSDAVVLHNYGEVIGYFYCVNHGDLVEWNFTVPGLAWWFSNFSL